MLCQVFRKLLADPCATEIGTGIERSLNNLLVKGFVFFDLKASDQTNDFHNLRRPSINREKKSSCCPLIIDICINLYRYHLLFVNY